MHRYVYMIFDGCYFVHFVVMLETIIFSFVRLFFSTCHVQAGTKEGPGILRVSKTVYSLTRNKYQYSVVETALFRRKSVVVLEQKREPDRGVREAFLS